MIYPDEQYIQIAEFDDKGEIRFTKELLEATKDFPGVRKFVARLITHWEGDTLDTILDYFGPDDREEDIYSGIDGDPMSVRVDIPDLWSYKDLPIPGLDSEWYQDVMLAKLVSIKLPERLIKAYVKAANKYYTQ
jgi:hypothetical protein